MRVVGKMGTMRSPDALAESFRAQGHKMTPQRRLLFDLLHENSSHPTAEALYRRASAMMPGISLRTVYQTLTDLTCMGELRQVSFGSGPAHFDPNVADHHHAVCGGCGAIHDVYVDGVTQLSVDGASDFRSDAVSIVFHGTCASCAGT